MQNAPQLHPVQAWMLGYLSHGELMDLLDDPADRAMYGRTLTDPCFATELIANVGGWDGVA